LTNLKSKAPKPRHKKCTSAKGRKNPKEKKGGNFAQENELQVSTKFEHEVVLRGGGAETKRMGLSAWQLSRPQNRIYVGGGGDNQTGNMGKKM